MKAETQKQTTLADFKVGDWIYDDRCELKQIIEIDDDSYRYSDSEFTTTASSTGKCWPLNLRNMRLAKFLQRRIAKLDNINAFTDRCVRDKFYDFTERLFNLPYGKDKLTDGEVKQCNDFYDEVDRYTDFIIEQHKKFSSIKDDIARASYC